VPEGKPANMIRPLEPGSNDEKGAKMIVARSLRRFVGIESSATVT
jgi:hypothetical protein